ncbi:MAG: hypothetical protein JRF63_06985 [Deltaproteobacteria bacterium]|nr:hypothetical protein [Deltaproteobacteria bacterium]
MPIACKSTWLAISLAAAISVAATGRPAGAVVLSEDEFEETSTIAGAIARAFAFVLAGETLEPPLMLGDMNPTGLGIFDLRLYFEKRSPSLKLVVHNQLTSVIRSHALLGAANIGRGASPPRLLALRFDLTDEPTLGVRNTVDWLYVAWSRDSVTATLGRQPVTFGRGKLWSPSDLVGTFALTEVDTEYKPGADALRVDWSPSEKTTVTAVASAGELEDDDDMEATLGGSSFLAQVKRTFGRGEAGLMAGYIRGDAVAGVDGVVDTGSFEVYGEATLSVLTKRSLMAAALSGGDSLQERHDVIGKAVLGATFRPRSKITLSPEVLYNGFGSRDAGDYYSVATSDRAAIGEQTLLGQLHAGLVVNWEAHPLVNVAGVSLVNALDPSALASVSVSYSVSDNAQALIGGYAPIGKTPESAIEPEDEFGMYPYFLFFELKAVM